MECFHSVDVSGDTEVLKESSEKVDDASVPVEILEAVRKFMHPFDLEAHPFLVCWYNELVGPKFVLDYDPSTLCFAIISGPSVFEKAVLPFIQTQLNRTAEYVTTDPLDESMKTIFQKFSEQLKHTGFEADVYHDYELHHTRRPKVLVQTAAHVAGAAEYVLPTRLTNSVVNSGKKLYGVAVHPRYGGWFAIRGIVVVKNTQLPLKKKPTLNLMPDDLAVEILLEEFSYRWQDNLWRDVVRPIGGIRYSDDFIEYLEIGPDARWDYVKCKNMIKDESLGC